MIDGEANEDVTILHTYWEDSDFCGMHVLRVIFHYWYISLLSSVKQLRDD